MQISKGKLKQLIKEESQRLEADYEESEKLLESYSASYEVEKDFVSKDAVMDFLEVLQESKVPKLAFEAFIRSLPYESTRKLLKEAVE